jgi:SAM-dependent methyltransferase
LVPATARQSADPPNDPAWRRAAAILARKWRGARLELHYRYGRSARNVTRRNSRRAYEKLYAADDLLAEYLAPERLAFYDEVASIAAQYAGRSVVDVGCGSGNLLRSLLDRVADDKGVEVGRVLALDHAGSALRRAAELVPEAEGRVFDLMRDDLGGERFDLVLCTEVLEHIRRPHRAREFLASACGRQGAIVITVPDGAVDAWEGHVNFWTHDEFQAFLEPLGETTVHRIDADRGLLAIVRPD